MPNGSENHGLSKNRLDLLCAPISKQWISLLYTVLVKNIFPLSQFEDSFCPSVEVRNVANRFFLEVYDCSNNLVLFENPTVKWLDFWLTWSCRAGFRPLLCRTHSSTPSSCPEERKFCQTMPRFVGHPIWLDLKHYKSVSKFQVSLHLSLHDLDSASEGVDCICPLHIPKGMQPRRVWLYDVDCAENFIFSSIAPDLRMCVSQYVPSRIQEVPPTVFPGWLCKKILSWSANYHCDLTSTRG